MRCGSTRNWQGLSCNAIGKDRLIRALERGDGPKEGEDDVPSTAGSGEWFRCMVEAGSMECDRRSCGRAIPPGSTMEPVGSCPLGWDGVQLHKALPQHEHIKAHEISHRFDDGCRWAIWASISTTRRMRGSNFQNQELSLKRIVHA